MPVSNPRASRDGTGPWLLRNTSHLSTICPDTAFAWQLPVNIGNMSVVYSLLFNCQLLQAKHCPNIDDEAYCSKKGWQFKVEVNEIVVIPSWLANLFCVVRIVMFGYVRMCETLPSNKRSRSGVGGMKCVAHKCWRTWWRLENLSQSGALNQNGWIQMKQSGTLNKWWWAVVQWYRLCC